MHIPVIVMLVISVLSLIGLFAIDWNISHGKEQHKERIIPNIIRIKSDIFHKYYKTLPQKF